MKIFSVHIKIIAAFLMGCFFLAGCGNSDDEINEVNKQSAGRDEAKNIVMNYTIGGRRKAVLKSPLMYRIINEDVVEFPKSIHVDFYNEETDSLDSKLDAKYAKYQQGRSIVFLRDSVRVINVKGDTLYCDELYWDRSRKDHEFYTEKPVRIRQKMQYIDGIGMDARQDFKEYNIIKVTGIVKVADSQFPN